MADGILKFDALLSRRKIRVFVIEKCWLGNDCKRKECMFGHGENMHLVMLLTRAIVVKLIQAN